MKEIIVVGEKDQYRAYLRSNPGIWGKGPTPEHAIGALIASGVGKEALNIKITMG